MSRQARRRPTYAADGGRDAIVVGTLGEDEGADEQVAQLAYKLAAISGVCMHQLLE